MNKQGVELTLNTIVIAVIVLIVLAVVLLIFSSLYGGGAGQINCFFGGVSQDFDSDGARNAVDACPCDADIPRICNAVQGGEIPAGCPGSSLPCPTDGKSCQNQINEKNKNTCA